MRRVPNIVGIAVLLLLAVEAIARVAERAAAAPVAGNRSGAVDRYRASFLIELVGTQCGDLPRRLEDGLRRAGLSRIAVLNVCDAERAFLDYGLPMAPRVVLTMEGSPLRRETAQPLAMLRWADRFHAARARGWSTAAEVNSAVYRAEVERVLTQSQGGWFAVLLPAAPAAAADAFTRWSGETGAPVFEISGDPDAPTELERQGLFTAIAEEYRSWEEHGNRERTPAWQR